jgi:hypothetical protein
MAPFTCDENGDFWSLAATPSQLEHFNAAQRITEFITPR